MTERIWAPWRVKYVTGKRKPGCVFCKTDPRRIVERSQHSFIILNIFPYNPGHIMIVPKRHIRDLNQLRGDEWLDLFQMVERGRFLLERSIKPQGYNIGINLGKFAGAGIWNHLHIHIVPRWLGDTNCMPVIAGTKIISVSLDSLSKILRKTAAKYPAKGFLKNKSRN